MLTRLLLTEYVGVPIPFSDLGDEELVLSLIRSHSKRISVIEYGSR